MKRRLMWRYRRKAGATWRERSKEMPLAFSEDINMLYHAKNGRTRGVGIITLFGSIMRSLTRNRFCFILCAAVACFVCVCSIEALYWPLVMKPGTEVGWWQVGWLAKAGYFVGFPVTGAEFAIGMLHLPRILTHIAGLLVAAACATFVFRVLLRWSMMPNKSPEATPGQRPPAAPSPSSGAPQL